MKNNSFVFDTNTLVSAVILPRSVPAVALRKAESTGLLFASVTTFDELAEVLQRPKLEKYLTLNERLNFLDRYRSLAIFFPITHHVNDCRDPKDDKFLDLALAAQAHCLITGDQDLLVLNPYHTTQILSPADFLATF